MVCWSMNFTFRTCSMHTQVKKNSKISLRQRQILHTSHCISYSAERKWRASPPWPFMLCMSPMLSLLKLQQKTTLHIYNFINACSAEKTNQSMSLQLTVNRWNKTKNLASVDGRHHTSQFIAYSAERKWRASPSVTLHALHFTNA